ncbi:HAD family hydrolase [Arthrobacter caoxuetaonis]|uniref:HAD family hydrolase n=1 Tax=Arthrobacter caoxuetaonis TaxID=2886935 RepID=UPI001D14776C|nr:HAD hydrolase family protein [Arthrobacter caoxuetaonis]MCC3281718.1 HAD family hydrolase [Arthrobacter caoxuetaonis]
MRLVASDLDGTIVGRDNRISDRTVNAFRKCADAGIKIVFVTGRPPRWLGPIRDQLGHTGTVICSNGAILYDLKAARVTWSRALGLDGMFQAAGIIRRLYPAVRFAAETVEGFHLEPGFLQDGGADLLGEVAPAPLVQSLGPGSRVVKFLARVQDVHPDEFLRTVQPEVAHLVSTTHSSPSVPLLEMSAPGLDKAVTLAEYAASLQIEAADVVAFGDMPNDLGMLGWAGRGYAMASGHPAVRAAAARTAPPFEEDGVAQVLEDLLSGR